MDEILRTAKSCRHYSMCKIDYLGKGVCPSGLQRRYAAYYPVGRMDIYAALAEDVIGVTEECVRIASSCDLCGACDYQCYFVTQMRPSTVMKALKEKVSAFLESGGAPEKAPEDPILRRIRKIVGGEWATNDRAVALAYSHDPCPIGTPKMPAYVILPGNAQEVAKVVRLLKRNGIPWVARGNGSSIMSLVMSEGAVIDVGRIGGISFDERNWLVRVGAGVSAFELQTEAARRGYRVNLAEPAAMVCSNIVGTGVLSTFMAGYGTAADNFIDAQFVSPKGRIFSLSDPRAPNLFAFRAADVESPGVCTAMSVRLHPIPKDEEGLLVPFAGLEEAVDFVGECAVRRIGLALAVLGGEYTSSFMSPTRSMAADARKAFKKLGMNWMVLVIGDALARRGVQEMGRPFMSQRMFRALNLGLPSLGGARWLDLVAGLENDEPFSYLRIDGFEEMMETALAPSPAGLAGGVDPEFRAFFEELYRHPKMTDLVWLNTFRIVSSRMGREGHFLIFVIYLPLERELVTGIVSEFRRIASARGLRNELGFLAPVDCGKRALLEYDVYFDQTDQDQIDRIREVGKQAGVLIERYIARFGTIRWIRHVVNQGVCRKENLFYA
jgi:hypothetical protein